MYQKNTTELKSDGIAIAVKNTIQHNIIDAFLSDLLAIELETSTGKIIIATLYQPPSRDYLPIPDFITLFRRNSPVYMIADLNANHPNFGYNFSNIKGRQLTRLIKNRTIQHLGPHFPTYFTNTRGTNPDIILSNHKTYHNYNISQGPLTTSDHLPIIFTLSTSPILIPSPRRPHFSKANWESFTQHIEEHIQQQQLNHANLEEIDQAIDEWYTTINTAISKYIPITYYRPLPAHSFSHGTKIIHTAFKNLQHQASRYGWTHQTYQIYKYLRHQLSERLTREANESWGKTIQDTSEIYKESSTFWKKIKNLTGQTTPDPHYILNENNIKKYKPEEKEQIHRNIWERVFKEEEDEEGEQENHNNIRAFLNENIHRIHPYNNADTSRLNSTNLDKKINIEEIEYYIKKSKKTCPGSSGINKTILTNLPNKALISLANIFNAALSSGYFPDIWKASTLKLIPKAKKSPHHAGNYRPISLLEVPGKMFERILNSRLKSHLEYINSYNENQFGFRSGRGTNQALAIITELIAQNKSNNGHCQIILRDITKAFDKVWHLGMKFKLLQLNLPLTIEKILCDFLDDRTAQIKINNHTGPKFEIQTGVPQGSVLSPTLFTIYTNDAPPPLKGENITYADDITQIIGYKGKSKQMINRITQKEIIRINKFEDNWKIKTNINKFTPIHLSVKNTIPLEINNSEIPFQKEGKSLGLTITSNGYGKHVQDRKNKATAALYRLYRLNELPEKIKVHLVKALILPIIQYPPIPLHTMSKTQISILQKVQNKALRFATNQRYPYTMTTEQIHIHTRTKPINIFLHEQAIKIWQTLGNINNSTVNKLIENREHIDKYHRSFSSSLTAIMQDKYPYYH